MPRWLVFLLFITVAVLIVGSVHYYFYRRLVVSPQLPLPWRTVATISLAVLAVVFPLSFPISRLVDLSVARIVLFPIYIWVGMMLMLFFLLLGTDLVRGAVWLVSRAVGHEGLLADLWRVSIARVVAGASVGIVSVATIFAVFQGLSKPTVLRVEVELRGLPAAMNGFTIAQLTDLHLGAMRDHHWLKEVVGITNGLEPDLIAITGDLADGLPEKLPAEVALLGKLRARHGVFFVTGNHEYFYDLKGWLRTLRELGVRVLRNERVRIGEGGDSFDLAGVDDHEGRRLAADHGADAAKALRGRDSKRAMVLLAHQPRVIEAASQHGVGLVLTGHTHGGQIWPWNYLVYLQQPYVKGLHDHEGTKLYVNQGTGFWGPPMRLGTRSEIALITLRNSGA